MLPKFILHFEMHWYYTFIYIYPHPYRLMAAAAAGAGALLSRSAPWWHCHSFGSGRLGAAGRGWLLLQRCRQVLQSKAKKSKLPVFSYFTTSLRFTSLCSRIIRVARFSIRVA